MRLIVLALGLVLTVACPALAQRVVADLSQSRVSITASFSGSQILVFGAIKPEVGSVIKETYPVTDPLSVIVTVSGPLEPVKVRKKSRVAGIWVNSESVEIDSAPTLYKIAASSPLTDILSETEDLRHRISIPKAIRSVGEAGEVEDLSAFTEALVRIRMANGLYESTGYSVRLSEQALFRADIDLPSNIVEGEYTTRIFLTRNQQVVAEYARVLDVRKVGLERWIYNLAQEQALLYGLLSLAIAVASGWTASALFRWARG